MPRMMRGTEDEKAPYCRVSDDTFDEETVAIRIVKKTKDV